jgi:hypothetical protein
MSRLVIGKDGDVPEMTERRRGLPQTARRDAQLQKSRDAELEAKHRSMLSHAQWTCSQSPFSELTLAALPKTLDHAQGESSSRSTGHLIL